METIIYCNRFTEDSPEGLFEDIEITGRNLSEHYMPKTFSNQDTNNLEPLST